MIEGTEAITLSSLSLALDAAMQRQQLIASNIANANTEGYVARRVDFDAYLKDARSQLMDYGRIDAAMVANLAATPLPVRSVLSADGTPAAVQLDAEVAEMAQNAVQYQALLKGLSRHLGIIATAVSDGKR